jgi:hypothetical protein
VTDLTEDRRCVCRGCASPMCNAIKGSKDARCNRNIGTVGPVVETMEGPLCVPCSTARLKGEVSPK